MAIHRRGLHGTSKMSAESIKHSGFHVGTGRAGPGVYFWVDGPLSRDLAEGWFEQIKSKAFRNEANPQCAVIEAELECDDHEHLDLEMQKFKSQMMLLAVKHDVDLDNDEGSSILHAMVIKQLESELGTKIKILEVRVAPPKKELVPRYKLKAYGAPLSYVVRDATCIVQIRVA